MQWFEDKQMLMTCSKDKTIKLWDALSGQEIRTLRGHKWVVSCVAFRPDGLQLAIGRGDQGTRIWGLDSLTAVTPSLSPTGGVWSVAFSPKGDRLATAHGDQTVRVWETGAGAAVLGLVYLALPLRALADIEMRWGHPATLAGFWDTVTAKQFQRAVTESRPALGGNLSTLFGMVAGDMGWSIDKVYKGGLRNAVQSLSVSASPQILFVDLAESGDPLNDINALL